MTLGDKLSKLRKENNYTQEQLAELLSVSRQAVSKWESDTAYPETEKLLKLGELYGCSMDYLLKDEYSEPVSVSSSKTVNLNFQNAYFERVSKKSFHGIPLWHVNIGFGRTAKGIIAVGFSARGVISVGLLSFGIISFGLLALGLLAWGTVAIGILSAGAISCGVIAFGAISIGVVSVGALSVGLFSVGASANGKYFALGDHARALIALGGTKASGGAYQKVGELIAKDIADVKAALDENVPRFLLWAKELIKPFIR